MLSGSAPRFRHTCILMAQAPKVKISLLQITGEPAPPKPFGPFILGGNDRDFPGPLKDPGKSLSVAAPLRIEGLRCLVTKSSMAGARRILRRLPCNRIFVMTSSTSCPAPTGHLHIMNATTYAFFQQKCVIAYTHHRHHRRVGRSVWRPRAPFRAEALHSVPLLVLHCDFNMESRCPFVVSLTLSWDR